MQDRDLMRLFMRTSSMARCKPWRAEGDLIRKPSGMGHVLDLVHKEDGLSQQEIAARLEIRPQSVSEALTRLEERGLIRKETDAQDRRVTRIYITPEGIAHRVELAKLRTAHAEAFFAVLTEEEKAVFASLLRKLNDASSDQKEGTT